MRTCKKCLNEYKDYGQKACLCRSCKREYDREYHKNRSVSAKKQKQALQKTRISNNAKKIQEIKNKGSCAFCEENEPICLDFHHLEEHKKENTISNMTCHSWDKIKEEIDKCILVCSNCHRKLHKGLLTIWG